VAKLSATLEVIQLMSTIDLGRPAVLTVQAKGAGLTSHQHVDRGTSVEETPEELVRAVLKPILRCDAWSVRSAACGNAERARS